MKAIDGCELLRKIKGRAEVVHPTVHMFGVGQVPGVFLPPQNTLGAAVIEPEDACAAGQHRVPGVRFVAPVATAQQPCHACGETAQSVLVLVKNSPQYLRHVVLFGIE